MKIPCRIFWIIFLNIHRPRYIITVTNHTQNNDIEDVVGEECERETSCNNVYVKGLPYCYCDDLCEQFKDCCRFDNETNTLEGHGNDDPDRYKIPDPYLTSTCFRIGDDISGFWVVNRCAENGSICSENRNVPDVFINRPVSDSTGLTYMNADCARCNNVQVYRPWGILLQGNGEGLFKTNDFLELTEATLKTNIESYLQKNGSFKLVTPPWIMPRVCYGYSDTSYNCSRFQHPVLGGNNEVFKDMTCCRMSGSRNCDPVGERSNMSCWSYSYKYIKIYFDPRFPIDYVSPNMEVNRVLFQFAEYESSETVETKCNKENKGISDDHCSSRNIKITGYSMRKRYLTLVWQASFDMTIVMSAIRAINTFLLRSKWTISVFFNNLIPMDIVEGSMCSNHGGLCTAMTWRLTASSLETLTVEDIISIESWVDKMDLEIYLQHSATPHPQPLNGSYAIEQSFMNYCRCGMKNERKIRNFNFSINEFHLLALASRVPKSCGVYILNVTGDRRGERLGIACRKGEMTNKNTNAIEQFSFLQILTSFLFTRM